MATGTVDAAGADTYTELLAAPTTETQYTAFQAWVSTKDAIISIDGGTTDFAVIKAGAEPVTFYLNRGEIEGAIQGKNQTAGQNYANLFVNAW